MNALIGHERGLLLNYEPFFNSLVPESWSGLTAGVRFQPEEIDAALARTELRWRPMPDGRPAIRLSLKQVDGCLQLEAWSGDAAWCRGPSWSRSCWRSNACWWPPPTPTCPAARCPASSGWSPSPHCPPDTGRPLLGGRGRRAAPPGRGRRARRRPRLRLGRRPPARRPPGRHRRRPHPQQAHARCMALLIRHPTAITPRHYVICPTAPPDPADPAAWPPPLAAGTGR